MQLFKKILNKLNGLHYTQEYLCLSKEIFEQPLHAYIVNNNSVVSDVTNTALFVGYSPLVFAFAGKSFPHQLPLIFTHNPLLLNGKIEQKDAIARLNLKLIKQQQAGSNSIFYYEAIKGTHFFQPAFQRFVNAASNRLYNKKPGNVFLPGNLYQQVQIAYAVPRIISLITVSNENLFNLFPTDLHGTADGEHYVISLRTGGKACSQVLATGKLVVTQVDSSIYKTVYSLGKNHMQPLKEKDHFPFGSSLSATFNWPLPQGALAYKELLLQHTFTHGIHTILLFAITAQQQLISATTTLAHIGNSYATWRYKNGLAGNYLLR